MPELRVIFFDVGGVLLTNGWDRVSRLRASEHFGLDGEDVRERHGLVAADFETGKLTIDEYLRRVVFHQGRDFSADEFVEFMKAQSEPFPESLAVVAELAQSEHVLLATLNNESRELNDYRIDKFGLRDFFPLFLSSCYLGVRKPEPEIFSLAIDVVQERPSECLFIDDRSLNVECGELAGIPSLLFRDVTRLRSDLSDRGVKLPAADSG